MALRKAKLFGETYMRIGANTGLAMLCGTKTRASELIWKKAVVRCDQKHVKQVVEGCIGGKEQLKLRLVQERMQKLEEHTGYRFDEVLGYVVPKVAEEMIGVNGTDVPDWNFSYGNVSTLSGPCDVDDQEESMKSIIVIGKTLQSLTRRAVACNASSALKQLQTVEESIICGAPILRWWKIFSVMRYWINWLECGGKVKI